jgi:transaldolase
MDDPLKDLTAAGVSIWLDDLSRPLLTTGALKGLDEDSHIVGITSSPTIFANAIGGSADYDDQIRELAQRGTQEGLTTFETSWATVTDELSHRLGAMAHHPNTNPPLLHDKAYS